MEIFRENIFFSIIVIAWIAAMIFGYIRFVILGEYYLFAAIPCDMSTTSCFVPVDCETFAGEDTCVPYKLIFYKASAAPVCTFAECPELTCDESDAYCRVVTCTMENLIDYGQAATCRGGA